MVFPCTQLVYTVGGQCNGNSVCLYSYVHATHANYVYMGSIYMHYIARIAVISNCAGWHIVYFRYMYHEYFSTADDKRPMRCMQPEKQLVFIIATYTMYQLYFISIPELAQLHGMSI